MNYQTIKVAKGKGGDINCTCETSVGEIMGWFKNGSKKTTDINEAYLAAASYNDRRKCGCRQEVKECE